MCSHTVPMPRLGKREREWRGIEEGMEEGSDMEMDEPVREKKTGIEG